MGYTYLYINKLFRPIIKNGALGIWEIRGEWLFIFRDLRSTGNNFREAGEQAHSFGDLGSHAKNKK